MAQVESPKTYKVEKPEIRADLKLRTSLRRIDTALSEFVPLLEREGETILPPVTVVDRKGIILVSFSGQRNISGELEEGRLHIEREKGGERKRMDIVVSLSSMQSAYEAEVAYEAIRAASRVYKRSELSRR